MAKPPKFKNCIVCGDTFQMNSPSHRKCHKHWGLISRRCLTCDAQFYYEKTGNKRAGRYCKPECRTKKLNPTPPPELKPAIPLATGRPKGPTIEKIKDYCAVCKVVIPNENKISKYCTEHRYYAKVQCRYCKEDFHTPRSDKKLYCQETCRLNDQKPCQVCGVYFQPITKGQIYCDTHNKGGPDGNKYSLHWKMGAPAFVGNPKDNPYKAGVLKPCEATEKHPDCSGTMMVFANEWTRCIHCAKMLTRQTASISHVRDF